MESFKNRLEEAMRQRKMTASKLAEKSGLSKSSISRYLSGNYDAGRNNLYLLSQALEVDEGWLMGGDCEMEPHNNNDFAMTLTNSEKRLLEKYRAADDEKKHLILYLLDIGK